jgi:hypothetical protein
MSSRNAVLAPILVLSLALSGPSAAFSGDYEGLNRNNGSDFDINIHNCRHMLERLGQDFSPSPLNSSPVEGEELWRKTLSLEKGLLGLIFNKSQNKFQDPSKLRRLFRKTCMFILPQFQYHTPLGRYHTYIKIIYGVW